MKFRLENKALVVTGEDSAEVVEILGHCHMPIEPSVGAISAGKIEVTFPKGRDNGEWFEVTAELSPTWFDPYVKKLAKLTGYTGAVPWIEAPRYSSKAFKNLCPTHIVIGAWMSSEGFKYVGYVHSSDWCGKTAAERCQGRFAGACAIGIGGQKYEPEYIEMKNGLLRRNMKYPRFYAPHPEATSAAVLEKLMQWWLDNKATPGQREVIERCMKNHCTVCKNDTMGQYFLRMYEPGYRVAWGGLDSVVLFETFYTLT